VKVHGGQIVGIIPGDGHAAEGAAGSDGQEVEG
jgi:hypothetical protein